MSYFIIGGTNVLFYYRWHKCCGGTNVFFIIGGTNVTVGQMSYVIIGGTNVSVGQMLGGTNVGRTNVGGTCVSGNKSCATATSHLIYWQPIALHNKTCKDGLLWQTNPLHLQPS
jgi:hypothetical protein